MALIVDVSPRDGLQNDPIALPAGIRAELCRRLAGAGVRRIEAVSFVSPRHVPAMAGAEDVLAQLADLPPELLVGLVLNERGYERAQETQLRRLNLAVAVTESFSRRNQGAPRDRVEAFLASVLPRASAAGLRCTITVSVCFGCPFEGRVPPAQVLELVQRLAALGPEAIVLADTIGVAVPRAVVALTSSAAAFGVPIGGHFHDTRGTAVANALAALEAGAVQLDASAGGVGGCPFAPGATGNLASEDLVYALEESGLSTGIDLDALISTSRWLGAQLGHELPGAVTRAGGFPLPGDSGGCAPPAGRSAAR